MVAIANATGNAALHVWTGKPRERYSSNALRGASALWCGSSSWCHGVSDAEHSLWGVMLVKNKSREHRDPAHDSALAGTGCCACSCWSGLCLHAWGASGPGGVACGANTAPVEAFHQPVRSRRKCSTRNLTPRRPACDPRLRMKSFGTGLYALFMSMGVSLHSGWWASRPGSGQRAMSSNNGGSCA